MKHDRDAIIKVTSCAICGSDIHLFDQFMPGMKKGDIVGHETGHRRAAVAANTIPRPGLRQAAPDGREADVDRGPDCGDVARGAS